MENGLTEERDKSYRAYDKLFATRNVENNATHLIPYIKPNSRIIDVGCGIGNITLDFARRASQGYVLGIDPSATSIAKAQADAKAQGLTNIEFKHCSAEDMSSIEAGQFDIAHSHQVFLHLPDPVPAMKQVHRVLKPGGVMGTRDAINVHFYPIMPSVKQNIMQSWEMRWNRDVDKPEGGLINHVWMHEAGFDWESIEHGQVAWSWPREFLHAIIEESAKEGGGRKDVLGMFGQEMADWAARPESRMVAFDGWVVGKKAL